MLRNLHWILFKKILVHLLNNYKLSFVEVLVRIEDCLKPTLFIWRRVQVHVLWMWRLPRQTIEMWLWLLSHAHPLKQNDQLFPLRSLHITLNPCLTDVHVVYKEVKSMSTEIWNIPIQMLERTNDDLNSKLSECQHRKYVRTVRYTQDIFFKRWSDFVYFTNDKI